MEQSRIFLVGFMASGKSRIGKLLANKLQYKYVDADDYIEAKAQQTIPQIFEERGEAYFRELEQTCLHELVQEEQILVSTGGGMACHFDNMEQMNRSGLTIFLEVPPPIITSRLLQAKNTRPLVKKFEHDRDALLNFIEGKLTERLPFYRQAQITVDCKMLIPTKIARLLHQDILSKKTDKGCEK
ncbi:MAG: shikimate kinase [Chitinophagales bacterium]